MEENKRNLDDAETDHDALPKQSKSGIDAQKDMQPENPPPCCTAAKKKTKKTKKEKDEEKELEFIWICTECREAECIDDPNAPLIMCDGKCNRPFHPPCANLLALPPEDVPWLCGDCLQNRHQCAVCKEYGEDDIDVFCCDAKGCGLFYHQNCLDVYNVHVDIVEEEVVVKGEHSSESGGEEKKECNDDNIMDVDMNTKIISRPKFKCPAHQCWTCADDIPPPKMDDEVEAAEQSSGKKKGKKRGGRKRKIKNDGSFSAMWGSKKEKLFRCLDCPIAYHITCMPPSGSFHELAMLCHEHAHTSKLPYLDAEHSFQAKVEANAQKRIDNLKRREELRVAAQARGEFVGSDDEDDDSDGENPFFPGVVGSLVTLEEEKLAEYLRDDDDNVDGKRRKKHHYHYCLPCDFKDEVHSKPPAYTHVNVNRYDPKNRPKRHPPNDECCKCVPVTEDCVKSCDEACLNRLSYTECVGDENLKSGSKNPYWNCNCGPNCGNRGMSKRQFAKCRPMREHGKGWGLIAVNGVKRGDLVQEYAGEIIDDKEKEERLKAWSRDHPNDPNFYVMHLEPGWYIDAREVANMARFINHSCDPNCRLIPTNVSGHIRVAIVCIKDVPPGGFLSYDYQFDTKDGDKFICRCGAANCRGTMKGGKNGEEDDAQKKTKKQLLAEAKARIKRDKQFLLDLQASEKERLNLTGPFVPGEDKEKAEAVAAGPNECYRQEVQENRTFLWRNARIGGDYSSRSRYWTDLARKSGKTKLKVKLATVCQQKGKIDVISMIS
mmetsp:Transcript_6372/g.13412  ORF Transcript_6372/g.13412 Transcript_6372/m.13412 type:complete len:774 (-) Transcript_6372:503-2824(-)